MDGFRDRERMNRVSSDRGTHDRYDRDRYSRVGRYSAASADGLNAEEVTNIIEESNAKQLDVIQDFFEDAKEDLLESEQQIISAVNTAANDIIAKANSASADAKDSNKGTESDNKPSLDNSLNEEILKTVNSNNDILATFAEEQLPMLVRGNSSILNRITQSLEESDDVLRQILDNTNTISNDISGISSSGVSSKEPSYMQQPALNPYDNSEEILNTASNNGALLNALRSEVAVLQQQIKSIETGISDISDIADKAQLNQPVHEDETAPLDEEDKLTKNQADEMYKQLEEQIHSECVKVYRNLQKTLEEQNKSVIDGVGKGNVTVRIFALLAFVVGLFNLIISVLQILGIL